MRFVVSTILYAACTFRPYKSTPVLKLFRTFTGKMTRGLSLRMVFSLLFQDTLFNGVRVIRHYIRTILLCPSLDVCATPCGPCHSVMIGCSVSGVCLPETSSRDLSHVLLAIVIKPLATHFCRDSRAPAPHREEGHL